MIIYLAALMYGVSGLSKLGSIFLWRGDYLYRAEPLLGLSYEAIYIWAGGIELILVGLVVYQKFNKPRVKWGDIAIVIVSGVILAYRATIYLQGYQFECPCFGGLDNLLKIENDIQNAVVTIILLVVTADSTINILK